MRLTRLFIDGELVPGATLPLPRGAAQHIARVLRLQPGDELRLFNGGGGEFEARDVVIASQSFETDPAAHQDRSAHRGDRGEDHQQDRRDPQRKSGQEE